MLTTVQDEVKPTTEISPIHWSFCKPFTVGVCTMGLDDTFGNLFALFVDDYDDKGPPTCSFHLDVIPNHANSSEEFWKNLDNEKRKYTIASLIKSVDVWNNDLKIWKQIYDSLHVFGTYNYVTNDYDLFRFDFNC